MPKWNIVYYKSQAQSSPVYDFIESLDVRTQAKVANSLDLLAEFGVLLGSPHVKKVSGTPLWELRILGTNNLRILYIATIGKSFLLLHGFLKKKQKTDKREITIALQRLKDYQDAHVLK